MIKRKNSGFQPMINGEKTFIQYTALISTDIFTEMIRSLFFSHVLCLLEQEMS